MKTAKLLNWSLGTTKLAMLAQALADALKDKNCKVTALNLRWNDIRAAGAAALASALKNKNCKVTELDLMGNQIGDTGAKALADAVLLAREVGREIKIIGVENFEEFL